MPKKVNMKGLKFNRLLVISEIRNGGTKSCGCLASDFTIKRNTKHGLSKLPEYSIWKGMKGRCYNKNETHYLKYGGRGIVVCERWLNSFDNFLQDMGKRPSEIHSLDRVNNNGNYEPLNCRWATKTEQSNNRNFVRKFTSNGKSLSIPQWAKELKIPATTLYSRIKIMPFKSAIEALL